MLSLKIPLGQLKLTITITFISLTSILLAQTRTSVKTGMWSNKKTWDCNCTPSTTDSVVISAGHTVTLNATTTMQTLTVNANGIISDNGHDTNILGNVVINGTYNGIGKIILSGINTAIAGTGSISNTVSLDIIAGNKYIPTTANLIINTGDVNIVGEITVVNNGTITIGGSIIGTASGSTWINDRNSTFNIGGSLLTTGILNASALGNVVNYYGSEAQTIKIPSAVLGVATYHHLVASGSDNKTLQPGTLHVNGDVTITSTLNGTGATRVIHVRGNWINNNNFTEGSGSVVFDGTTDQSISRSKGDENFNNLIVNKPSGTLILKTNVIVGTATNLISASTLTMTAGNIDATNYTLTLGKGYGTTAAFSGALVYTSGRIIGKFKRFINTTGIDIVFPIGTTSYSRMVTVNFNNLTEGALIARFNSLSPGSNGLMLTENDVTLHNTFRDGYWSLHAPGTDSLASTDYNLQLKGDGFTGFNITPETRLLTRSVVTNAWTLDGTHASALGDVVKRLNITTISGEYAFGNSTNCLAPTPLSVTGNTQVCSGSMGEIYTVTNTPSNTYAWSIEGGAIVVGQGTNSITVNWSSIGSLANISVVETNSCTSGTEAKIAVNVNAIAPNAISGKVIVPQNGATSVSYSVPAQTNYTFTWSVSGGIINSGQGTRSISVKWGSAGVGSVCVIGNHSSCGSSLNSCLSISIYSNITSTQSGNWSEAGVWDCDCTPGTNDNVIIKNTHAITLNVINKTINNLTINSGGMLSTGSRALTVNGDFIINGTLSGTGVVTLAGSNTVLGGTGYISNSASLNVTANKSILTATSLTKSIGDVNVNAGVVITNNGTITLGGNIVGTDATSTWINSSNATLNIGGALLETGSLNAMASENTLNYTGALAQDIKIPYALQYANLSYSGAGIKNAPPSTILISGDFTADGLLFPNNGTINFNDSSLITGTTAVDFHHMEISGVLTSSNQSINIGGNFINNGTFLHNNGTVNFIGSSLIVGSVNPLFYNVKISGILNAPDTLLLEGNFTNDNVFNSNLGKVKFAGTATQYINGIAKTNFHDLIVSNSAIPSVSIESNQNLIGTLSLSANAIFDADGSLNNSTFTLVSSDDSPTHDASIAALPTGAQVDGKVKIQRYMSGENRIYRYISSPISNGTIADWMDDFPVTGNFLNPSSYPTWPKVICGFPLSPQNASLFYYDETKPGLSGAGYEAYPLVNTYSHNANLAVGRGYVTYIRECTNPTIIDVVGTVNQGTINIPVTYTNLPTHEVSSIGWNLVGNPYPSTIDWNQNGDLDGNASSTDVLDGWTKMNIAAAIAIKDNGSGMVRYWDGDSDDDSLKTIANGVIAMGQGFWVRTIGANPQLVIREGVKTKSSAEFYRRMTIPAIIITLKNTSIEDKAYIKVRETAENKLDYWDAPKINNEAFNLSTLSDDKIAMAINAVPAINCGSSFTLNMTSLTNGDYNILFSNRGDYDQQMIVVSDKFLKTTKNLNWDEPFSFRVTDDVASKVADRFSIVISEVQPEFVAVEVPATLCKPAQAQVTVTNSELGVKYSAWSTDGEKLSNEYTGRRGAFSIPINFVSGLNEIVLKAQNTCGIYDVSPAFTVLYENPSIKHVQADSICTSGSVSLSASSSTPNVIFNWYADEHSAVALFRGFKFETPVLHSTKKYFVSSTTTSGCESERVGVDATVITFEPATITQSGNILISNYANNTQWYFNNAPIQGAIGSTLIVDKSGIYSTVTKINDCEVRADYTYEITGIEYLDDIVIAYPNPVNDFLYVRVPSKEIIQDAYLVNATGVKMNIVPAISDKQNLNFNMLCLAEGFYVLKVETNNSNHTFKVIKVNTLK